MTKLSRAGSGQAVTYVAANGGGDTFDPGTRFHVKNGGGAPITVTVVAKYPCSHGFLHDMTFSVPNGSDRFITPPDSARFVDPADGLIHVTYSAVTSVTVAAIG